jgi:hypothetical protein
VARADDADAHTASVPQALAVWESLPFGRRLEIWRRWAGETLTKSPKCRAAAGQLVLCFSLPRTSPRAS